MADRVTRRVWMGASVSGVALAGIPRAAADQTQRHPDAIVEPEATRSGVRMVVIRNGFRSLAAEVEVD